MKKTLLALLIFLATPALADDIIIYNIGNNRVVSYLPSQDPAAYLARSDVLIYNQFTSTQTIAQLRTLTSTVPIKYLKHLLGLTVEMTVLEKAVVDTELEALTSSNSRLTVSDYRTMRMWDDFTSGTSTTGNIGSLSWSFTGGSVVLQPAVLNHPGILRRSTGTTSSTAGFTNISTTVGVLINPAELFDNVWSISLTQLDANTRMRIGLEDLSSDPPTNGIYFERMETDGTQWFAVCRTASVQTRTLVGTATTNWARLRIRKKLGAGIMFSIDGGAEVEVSTNVPTVMLNPFSLIKNQGTTTAKTVDHDYFDLVVTNLTR